MRKTFVIVEAHDRQAEGSDGYQVGQPIITGRPWLPGDGRGTGKEIWGRVNGGMAGVAPVWCPVDRLRQHP